LVFNEPLLSPLLDGAVAALLDVPSPAFNAVLSPLLVVVPAPFGLLGGV
jgi:hypothetical protein